MYQKYIPKADDYEIRPLFRLVGATLTIFLAYIFVIQAIPLFSIKNLQLNECLEPRLRRQLMCEFGNWLTSRIPNDFQGPAEAVSRLLFAGIMLYLTWRLLKPLLTKRVSSEHG